MVNVMLEYPGGYLELVPAGEFTFPDDRTGVMKTVVVDRHVKVCERYGRVKVTPGAVAFIGIQTFAGVCISPQACASDVRFCCIKNPVSRRQGMPRILAIVIKRSVNSSQSPLPVRNACSAPNRFSCFSGYFIFSLIYVFAD